MADKSYGPVYRVHFDDGSHRDVYSDDESSAKASAEELERKRGHVAKAIKAELLVADKKEAKMNRINEAVEKVRRGADPKKVLRSLVEQLDTKREALGMEWRGCYIYDFVDIEVGTATNPLGEFCESDDYIYIAYAGKQEAAENLIAKVLEMGSKGETVQLDVYGHTMANLTVYRAFWPSIKVLYCDEPRCIAVREADLDRFVEKVSAWKQTSSVQ
jgi:hypothetical protein